MEIGKEGGSVRDRREETRGKGEGMIRKIILCNHWSLGCLGKNHSPGRSDAFLHFAFSPSIFEFLF